MRGFFKLVFLHPDGHREKTGRVFYSEDAANEEKAMYENALKDSGVSVDVQEICRSCGKPGNIYAWGMCKSCCDVHPCYNCNLEYKGIDACITCSVACGE